MPNGEDKHALISKHLILVIILVSALLITEGLVFWLLKDTDNFENILTLVFGTFGAWIGAGAAYFFGRENMKAATDSMLKISGRTPKEILSEIALKDMKPRPIPGSFKTDDTLNKIADWLKTSCGKFFAAVVDKDEKYVSVINEEAVYRFVNNETEKQPDKTYSEIKSTFENISIQDIIDFFKSQKEKELQELVDYAMTFSEDTKAIVANEKLEKAGKYLAIIVDEQNKATGYVSTSDIRRLLTKES